MAQAIWVLEGRNSTGGWMFLDVFSKPEDAQTSAPSYVVYAVRDLHWDNAPFSSLGFMGKATIPLFKISMKALK